jgi:putative redox protein
MLGDGDNSSPLIVRRFAPIKTMECTINWLPSSGMAFSAETGSGHLLTMDGAPDGGGRNLAPRPMETLLAGAGACAAYDVVLILKRGRHQVQGCQVKVSADRAETDPKVFTRIVMHFIVSGVKLPEVAVQRAVQMSHDKYCSATAMLAKTAEIELKIEVVEA